MPCCRRSASCPPGSSASASPWLVPHRRKVQHWRSDLRDAMQTRLAGSRGRSHESRKRLTMRTVICFLATLCAIALSTPSTAHTVQEAIEEANSQFAQALNKGDAATVASFYTADATVLPPGAEAVNGRDAVRAFWQSAIPIRASARQYPTPSSRRGSGAEKARSREARERRLPRGTRASSRGRAGRVPPAPRDSEVPACRRG